MPKLASPTANVFERTLRRYYINPAPTCKNLFLSRHYATAEPNHTFNHPITEVVVLGGGVTGLASAYYLSKKLPNAKITLLEASPRLGGWLHSKTIDTGKGSVVFEQGPRSLRPNTPSALVTLDLISKLDLEKKLLRTPTSSIAAQNRFLYYPDHLVRMPSSALGITDISTILTESVFRGLIAGVFRELFTDSRSGLMVDESVGSFISRRFGSPPADNIASAIYHGIYAGDIYKLSARSLLPSLWLIERRHRSITGAQLKRAPIPVLEEDVMLIGQPKSINMLDTSIFTLVGGLGLLADALVADLQNNPNVTIRRETQVNMLGGPGWKPGMKIKISTSSDQAQSSEKYVEEFSHVISTISAANLSKIIDVPPLSQTPSVTVMVVNVFFSNPNILPVRGFGYLIPRSVPFSENPEFALGVIFDSDATHGVDNVPGTKVTVMLGGHWWDAWGTYPDEDQAASMAKAVLKRHLGINEEPKVIRASLQKDCIPQYTVGHDSRMAQASQLLEKYEGRLRVAGNSYTGIGLNDCLRAARDVVKGLVKGTGKTGLEMFVGGRNYVWVLPSDLRKK